MFAIIRTGGKQYRVEKGTVLAVEKLSAKPGASLAFDEVLLVGNGKEVSIGAPYVKGAKVAATVVAEGKADKKTVFRYHSKTRYRKLKGHRQQQTTVRVESVSL